LIRYYRRSRAASKEKCRKIRKRRPGQRISVFWETTVRFPRRALAMCSITLIVFAAATAQAGRYEGYAQAVASGGDFDGHIMMLHLPPK